MQQKTRKIWGWVTLVIAVMLWLSPFDLPGPVEEIVFSVIAAWLLGGRK